MDKETRPIIPDLPEYPLSKEHTSKLPLFGIRLQNASLIITQDELDGRLNAFTVSDRYLFNQVIAQLGGSIASLNFTNYKLENVYLRQLSAIGSDPQTRTRIYSDSETFIPFLVQDIKTGEPLNDGYSDRIIRDLFLTPGEVEQLMPEAPHDEASLHILEPVNHHALFVLALADKDMPQEVTLNIISNTKVELASQLAEVEPITLLNHFLDNLSQITIKQLPDEVANRLQLAFDQAKKSRRIRFEDSINHTHTPVAQAIEQIHRLRAALFSQFETQKNTHAGKLLRKHYPWIRQTQTVRRIYGLLRPDAYTPAIFQALSHTLYLNPKREDASPSFNPPPDSDPDSTSRIDLPSKPGISPKFNPHLIQEQPEEAVIWHPSRPTTPEDADVNAGSIWKNRYNPTWLPTATPEPIKRLLYQQAEFQPRHHPNEASVSSEALKTDILHRLVNLGTYFAGRQPSKARFILLRSHATHFSPLLLSIEQLMTKPIPSGVQPSVHANEIKYIFNVFGINQFNYEDIFRIHPRKDNSTVGLNMRTVYAWEKDIYPLIKTYTEATYADLRYLSNLDSDNQGSNNLPLAANHVLRVVQNAFIRSKISPDKLPQDFDWLQIGDALYKTLALMPWIALFYHHPQEIYKTSLSNLHQTIKTFLDAEVEIY